MSPHLSGIVAAVHDGTQLQAFLQGWIQPIYLALVGAAALGILVTAENKVMRFIQLVGVAALVAIPVFTPQVISNIGEFVGKLL